MAAVKKEGKDGGSAKKKAVTPKSKTGAKAGAKVGRCRLNRYNPCWKRQELSA